MSNNIRYNYSNGTGSIFPETHSKRIGVIIHLFCQFLSFNTKFPTDFGTIFQARDTVGMDTPNICAKSFNEVRLDSAISML